LGGLSCDSRYISQRRFLRKKVQEFWVWGYGVGLWGVRVFGLLGVRRVACGACRSWERWVQPRLALPLK
jgi:hypothetical protein